MTSPSPSDPDLWTIDPADHDPRDVIEDADEWEPDINLCELRCVECDERSVATICEKCEALIEATRGDLESEE